MPQPLRLYILWSHLPPPRFPSGYTGARVGGSHGLAGAVALDDMGAFAGCLISNIYTGPIVDIVFGSIATLLAACGTFFLRRRKWLLPLPPVILNGVIVGGYLTALYGGVWYVNMATVALGEFISCYVIGLPLLTVIRKNKQLTEFLK